tara:strand:- start:56 stop:955 length:900 start_codon:yes stop_codon:yes gene_type:complete
MKALFIFFLSVISFLLLPGCETISFLSKESKKDKDTTQVIRRIEAVAALGKLAPDGDIRKLASPISGFGGTPRVAKLLVNEGDTVSKGQIIAIFDNRPQILSDLSVLKARTKTLKLKIKMQEREISRYKTAAYEGATSLVILEEKEDELIKLQGELSESLARRNGLEADLANTELKTPIDGVILIIHTREGERANDKGVLEVGANQRMQAIIEVYESDINRVKINQKVVLSSENGGFEGPIRGVVKRISPQVRQRSVLSTDPTGDADARVVEVTVGLDPGSLFLVSRLMGMKVIARFEP